jgi:outer membrane lipoprotein carrier protein
MSNRTTIFLSCAVMLIYIITVGLPVAVAESNPALDRILEGIEQKYANSSFSAKFLQQSTIKAMELTDSATGKVYVMHPGKMRWEYEQPDRQIIITDGYKLWIYRPEDNQVMTGAAPEFFRDGKGASFLSDINLLRRKFDIVLLEGEKSLFHELKLTPREKTMDVASIRLSVSMSMFTVMRIATYNSYGDETRIELLNSEFGKVLDEDLFSFKIPEGVDVLKIDE